LTEEEIMSYRAFELWRDQPEMYPELSIIIPTYNEAKRILPTVAAIAVSVSGLGVPWELIVSDDGSKDGTATLLENLGWENLRVLRHSNTGKGGAVQRGALEARGHMVLFADADNSTPIQELPRLIAEVRAGHNIAIGSRGVAGAAEHGKHWARRLISNTFRWLVWNGLRLKLRDTQCGFKLFDRDSLHLFGRQQMQGFSFDLELLYLARKFGHRVSEVPVRWIDAPGSKVNGLRDAIKFARDIGSILVADHLFRRYRRPLAWLEPRIGGF
jgi:dolichyl-phosphate beta-glucosyltransferase